MRTLDEELVAIAGEELGALGGDGRDGQHLAEQGGEDEEQQHADRTMESHGIGVVW